MADIKDNREATNPEKIYPAGEQPTRPEQETGSIPERRESLKEDDIVSAELRKEIEMMQLDDKTNLDAEKKAETIEYLGEKEKIKHLLELARTKGLIYAIQVARKMNEPYLLDILHDSLAQEGYYKDFLAKNNQVNDDNKV